MNEKLKYMRDKAGELAELAKREHFEALAYLFEMAQIEAIEQLKVITPGDEASGVVSS
jgi:hypothetical protein